MTLFKVLSYLKLNSNITNRMTNKFPMHNQILVDGTRRMRRYRDPRSIKQRISGQLGKNELAQDMLKNLNQFKTQLQQYAISTTPTSKQHPPSILESPCKSEKPEITEFKVQGYKMDYDRYRQRGQLTPISEQSDQFSDQKVVERSTNSSYLIFKQSYSNRTPSPTRQSSAFRKHKMAVISPQEFKTFSSVRSENTARNSLSPEINSTRLEMCQCNLSQFHNTIVSVKKSTQQPKIHMIGRESAINRMQFQVGQQNRIQKIEATNRRGMMGSILAFETGDTYKKKSIAFMVPEDDCKLRIQELTQYATKLGMIVLSD